MSEYTNSLPLDPTTGLRIQRIEVSCFDRDETDNTLPEGWEVFSTVYEPQDEDQKWHESTLVRLIGPAREVWMVAAKSVGVTLTLAQ